MHSIQIHKLVTLIISLLYFVGLWHRGDQPTVKDFLKKSFYWIYHLLLLISLGVGAITNDKREKSIFLAEVTVAVAVLSVKVGLLMWKQNEILDLLNRVCVFSIRYDEDHKRFNDKLAGFIIFAFVFVISVSCAGILSTVALSFLGSEKTLYLEIAFPLNYKDNEIAFWIATAFVFTEFLLLIFVFIFTTIIWYVLLIGSLRYEVLGNNLKNMGRIEEKGNKKMTEMQLQNHFLEDLKMSIDAYRHLRELISDVELFFSGLFLMQFATSGLCICCSIYCLAFDIGDSFLERLMFLLVFLYLISELFMITYFGNEIIVSSNRLSYWLFESNWYTQPQSTKKCIIIFGEYLKQPQELVIGKLYPLTLETFTRILNSAYSMFNILKSFH